MNSSNIGEEKKRQIPSEALIHWYLKVERPLPWRLSPTPYHVWISEIMLQQTRIEAVKEYYARFLKRLPDIFALAEVEEDELMKLWEGLGYYSRAKNLKKAAETVVREHGGNLPAHYEELIRQAPLRPLPFRKGFPLWMAMCSGFSHVFLRTRAILRDKTQEIESERS